MDLNISGKSAIICASSKGLGKACALALAKEGVKVCISGRHQDSLDSAATEITTAGGGEVQSVLADVTTDEGREALLAACPAPALAIVWNTSIMPVTVPSRPSNGEIPTTVPIVPR